MVHPLVRKRRFGALAASAAMVVAGLAATATTAPAQAAAAPAPVAASVAAPAATGAPLAARRGAPDNYTPSAGAKFNKPIGTERQQYRLFRHINRAINSARPGSTIRIAVFSFADFNTANNLIAAHRRGVSVKLIFDDHKIYKAERKLQRALGKNPRAKSFAIFCNRSCRSDGGEMHGKMYQFRRSGKARFVTMVGSNNMTSHNAERQWSDLLTVVGDKEIYKTFSRWFGQLRWDRAVPNPRIAMASGNNLVLITPNNDNQLDGDPALNALRPVYCQVTKPNGRIRATRVFVAAHAWFGPRGYAIAQRVAQLAEQGCKVKVFYGKAFGKKLKRMLKQSPAQVRTSRHHKPKTHQKLLIVRGGYGGNPDADFVWTGSHNWTPWALKLDDVILRNGDQDVVSNYVRHFKHMWAHA